MKIFLDCDGSPITKIVEKVAQENKIDLVVVKNYTQEVSINYGEVVTVDIEPDAADLYIANHLEKNDLVITADYGLSALVLGKKGRVLNFMGREIDESNIEFHLDTRHIGRELRKRKIYSKNPPRKKSDNIEFERALREVLK